MKDLVILIVAAMSFMFAGLASAQENTPTAPSICQAIAALDGPQWANDGWPGGHHLGSSQEATPLLQAAVTTHTASTLSASEVSITYVGHSTFRIEDAEGLTIATDFAGFAGQNVIPEVVTMNHAHGTHFTVAPDVRIKHVLRGWGLDGKPAKHYKKIGSALIRNVTTDINNQWVGYEPDGNSIFIFEVAGLCIGHLGHLHQLPSDNHYAQIGRLDILMVPVDGGYTLNVADMSKVVKRVNASMVLPMHWFGTFSLGNFLEEIRSGFPVDTRTAPQITVSLNTLPTQPTVVVLPPESSFGLYDGD
ncbi:MAG: MBL fold metallo-hydrolase [Pseudomonadota bacterium]